MYFRLPRALHPEQYQHLLPVCFRLSSTNIAASNFKTHSSRLFSRPTVPYPTKTPRAARSKRANLPCRSQMKNPQERRQHTQGQNEIGQHVYPPSRARTAASDSVQSTAGREHERYPTLPSSSSSSSFSRFHAPPRTEPTIAERCRSVHAVVAVVAISARGEASTTTALSSKYTETN